MVTLAHLDRDPEAVPDLEAFIRAYAHNGNALFEAALAYAEAATVLADDRPTPAASPATPGAGRKPRDPAQAAAARGRARRYADRALELLQQACLLEHECKHALETHPYLQMLRDRPEFRALLRRIHPRRRYAAVWRPDSTDFIGRELHGLTPEAHRQRGHELAAAGYRPVAISVAAVNPDGPPVAASVWHRPILSEEARDARARRQANAAVALLRLGHPETVWPLLVSSPDPRRRTYLIHAFAALDTEPGLLLDRFAREPDVSVRRALLRSLGLYRRERLVVSQREAFTRTLLRVYREDPDPGLHAAAGWLLRRWGHDAETQQLDRERAQRVPHGDRRWYVNRQGQTFAVIPGPIDCWLGSPGAEPNRGEEPLRRRRIGRTYAIGTQLVTVEQFLRFRPRHAYEHAKSPDRAGPIIQVDWFEAARYCRWLSEQEVIPESQMCFPPISRIGPDMQLPPDYLRRTGYRLPTEAEWECACRAGAVTSRFYGNDPRLLPSYAWFTDDAHGRAWKVGLLAPNDWGLFDVHGNVEEWCLDASDGSLVYRSEGLPDEAPLGNLASDRVFRGGCYLKVAARARCAARGSEPAEKVFTDLGFRIARTLVPAEQIRPPH